MNKKISIKDFNIPNFPNCDHDKLIIWEVEGPAFNNHWINYECSYNLRYNILWIEELGETAHEPYEILSQQLKRWSEFEIKNAIVQFINN